MTYCPSHACVASNAKSLLLGRKYVNARARAEEDSLFLPNNLLSRARWFFFLPPIPFFRKLSRKGIVLISTKISTFHICWIEEVDEEKTSHLSLVPYWKELHPSFSSSSSNLWVGSLYSCFKVGRSVGRSAGLRTKVFYFSLSLSQKKWILKITVFLERRNRCTKWPVGRGGGFASSRFVSLFCCSFSGSIFQFLCLSSEQRRDEIYVHTYIVK